MSQAAQLLKQVIGESEAYQWGSFDLPNLSNKPEDFNDSQFQEQINEVLMARRTIVDVIRKRGENVGRQF